MIPYFEQPGIRLGPFHVYAFGAIVAIAALVGMARGTRRFHRLGLDVAIGEGMVGYSLLFGFVGAHLFSQLFYFPEDVARQPLVLLQFWRNISSFGGMLGGLLGAWLYLRRHGSTMRLRTRLAYLDVAAFVFPMALATGRIACSLAHDHPGTVTRFPLAVSLARPEAQVYIARVYAEAGRLAELPSAAALATMGFHDLGWYEFLFLGFGVVPIMRWLDRTPRRPGFFLGVFLLLYTPVRFGLDLLRVSDVRYGGLTPAQYVAAAGFLTAVGAIRHWAPRPPPGDVAA